MSLIASYQQAEELGERLTGGKNSRDFTIYQYRQRWTNLTLFGIEIVKTKELVTHDDRWPAYSGL